MHVTLLVTRLIRSLATSFVGHLVNARVKAYRISLFTFSPLSHTLWKECIPLEPVSHRTGESRFFAILTWVNLACSAEYKTAGSTNPLSIRLPRPNTHPPISSNLPPQLLPPLPQLYIVIESEFTNTYICRIAHRKVYWVAHKWQEGEKAGPWSPENTVPLRFILLLTPSSRTTRWASMA